MIYQIGSADTYEKGPDLTLTCPIGYSLIRVDALVEIPAIEEILQQLLNLWDTC